MNPATHKVRLSALLAASCLLSACNSLPDWMGGDDG